MPTRSLLPLLAVLLAAAPLAGCGGSGGRGQLSNPTAEVLSYYGQKAAFVALVNTDPNGSGVKAAKAIADKIPGGASALSMLRSQLEQKGTVTYAADIAPLLGNDLAFGASSTTRPSSNKLLLAFVAKDKDKLAALIKKQQSDHKSDSKGKDSGFTLYKERKGNTAVAVKGPVFLIADTVPELKQAISRHNGSDSLKLDTVNKALGGLPANAPVRLYGNAAALLATPRGARARTVPWVAAFKEVAAAATVAEDHVDIDFRIDTTGRSLTEAEVPIAPGAGTSAVAGPGPITVGLRDPSHSLAFAQDIAKILSSQFSDFETAKGTIGTVTGVDIDRDLIGAMTSDSVVQTDAHKVFFRAKLNDPAKFADSIAKLIKLVARSQVQGYTIKLAGQDGYTVSRGSRVVGAFGVAGDVFVAGNGTLSELGRFASARPRPALGGPGAVTAELNSSELLKLLQGKVALTPIVQTLLGRLGGSQGSISATTKELRGKVTVALR